jgi:DGQHR domain-containing protein
MASKNNTVTFDALVAHQSDRHQVVMVRATAQDIHQIAQVDRLGREEDGKLTGFQRPQIAGHIAEIRRYLTQTDAVLPNALVVAFAGGAKLTGVKGAHGKLVVDLKNGPAGLVVDGQQRLAALTQARRADFQAFVACLICPDLDELRRQFILVNNTRPLPKSLIYELLPAVGTLPERLSSRSLAAAITERLNFNEKSSLHRQIRMQTNPTGVLRDTAIQKLIMNSESAGAIQTLSQGKRNVEKPVRLVNNFFAAVQNTFSKDWEGKKPTTSRLVHSAGLVAMGYVMDEIYAKHADDSVGSFEAGLQPLKGKTAWSEGAWTLAPGESTPWNAIEFTPRQYMRLAEYLVSKIRKQARVSPRRGR